MNPCSRKYCLIALACAFFACATSGCKKSPEASVNNVTQTDLSNAPDQEALTTEQRDVKNDSEKIDAACHTHSDCKVGQACIQQVCKSTFFLTCTTDIDCPDYKKCFAGKCAMCATDSDCSDGYSCTHSGICQQKSSKKQQNSSKKQQNSSKKSNKNNGGNRPADESCNLELPF